MSSTLTAYQQLKDTAAIKDFGSALPEVKSARLVISSETVTTAELSAKLVAWQDSFGWYQLTNQTALGMPADVSRLLEGEWYQQQTDATLVVRLVQHNQYLLTTMQLKQDDSEAFCYNEQSIWLREGLNTAQYNAAIYRHWYELQDDGYRSKASQFVGLKLEKE